MMGIGSKALDFQRECSNAYEAGMLEGRNQTNRIGKLAFLWYIPHSILHYIWLLVSMNTDITFSS